MTQGNFIAALALMLWPVASMIMFRYMTVGRAILGSVLIGYLFLPPVPAGFDPPLFPALTKDSIPNIVMILICLGLAKERIEWLPRNLVARALVITFVLSPILTVVTNLEPVFYGNVGLPGLRFVEAVAVCMQQALFLTPMLLARHFLAQEKDQRDVLIALTLAGLAYSLPALIEVRLSPQMNLWVYGFYQHSFEQTIRFGGYRPLVFLYHGIWLAFFLMTAVVSAVALTRASNWSGKLKYAFAAVYLAAVLFLCKSAGALVFAVLLMPMVFILSQRLQLTIAMVFASFTIVYPVLKQADMIPTERILSEIAELSEERSRSLEFRFDNEDVLLERAYEKPIFGWGTWGRNHLLDPVSGELLTVTDGRWIIVIGVFGWLGYLAEFGLLAFPIMLMWWKGARPGVGGYGLSPYIGPLALMLGINVFDLLPNATITAITWLFAGAVLGYAETYRAKERVRTVAFETVL